VPIRDEIELKKQSIAR
jgi:hypothetical protein